MREPENFKTGILPIFPDGIVEFDKELDTKGLNCPLPLLRLKMIMPELQAGEVLHVLATDPAAHLDFGVFTEKAGHEILAYEREGDVYHFYIRKNESP